MGAPLSNLTPEQQALIAKNAASIAGTIPAAGPGIAFATKLVQPPSEAYITVDDHLYVFIASGPATYSVTVNLRVLTPDGEIRPHQQVIPGSNSTYVNSFYRLQVPEGFLLSAVVYCNTAGLQRGQMYAALYFRRGASFVYDSFQMLAAGYLTAAVPLAYPPTVIEDPFSGHGCIYSGDAGVLPLGTDWTLTTPAGVIRLLRAARWGLQTDSVVASRIMNWVMIVSGENERVVYSWNFSTALNTLSRYAVGLKWGIDTSVQIHTFAWSSLPEVFLINPLNWSTETTNMDPGDRIVDAHYEYEEWLQPTLF